MILFLDDDHNRTKKFKSSVPWAYTAETAQEMISLLKKCIENNEVVEMLFLDHDLGLRQFVDSSDPNTGMEVVRWLEEYQQYKAVPKIDQIIVHSCNPPASYAMEAALKNLGYEVVRIPFPNLKLENIEKS